MLKNSNAIHYRCQNNMAKFLDGAQKCPSILRHPVYSPSVTLLIIAAEAFLLGFLAAKLVG